MTKKTNIEELGANTLAQLSLGKSVSYSDQYTPELLQAVPRSLSRGAIDLAEPLPFKGADIWNAYEISWLNSKGKPLVAIMQCDVPIDSPNLIESKSFKLYLNSFNQTRFDSIETVKTLFEKDLSQCAGQPVNVSLFEPGQFEQLKMAELPGLCIDDLDIEVNDYQLDPTILRTHADYIEETLTSNLLKSNCLITNQPDWASIMIRYHGSQIDHASLLQYLISFRMHNEFHEQCVERIFCDIQQICQPDKLTVYARYTRRGGLDINPFRSNFESPYRQFRQARQ